MDLIVVSPFWPSIDSDMPIETWKGLLIGTDTSVAVGLESGMHPGTTNRVSTHEELRGVAAGGLHRGADAVYFFNLFTSPYQRWPREHHNRLLHDAGVWDALISAPRRHPLTIKHPWSEGEPAKSQWLPHTGSGSFRVHIGPQPLPQQHTKIELVTPDHDEPLDVRLNGISCTSAGLKEAKHVAESGWEAPEPKRHVYNVPADAVSSGYNLIEVSTEKDVEITWVEISVQ